jgi:hypothetical protein
MRLIIILELILRIKNIPQLDNGIKGEVIQLIAKKT